MAGRPRLVEEGTPLWGTSQHGSEETHRHNHGDHHMEDAAVPAESEKSIPMPSTSSSLARAAGLLSQHHPSHVPPHSNLQTHLVIGGHTYKGKSSSPPEEHYDTAHSMEYSPPRTNPHPQHHPPHHPHQHNDAFYSRPSTVQTRLVIGGERAQEPLAPTAAVERMVGVEHHGIKGPLVVCDGANIAYAYADAMAGYDDPSQLQSNRRRREPDARGIQVAANYFLSMEHLNVRVLVVIPAPWFRAKPRPGDSNAGNAMMVTPQLEVLHDLKARGLLLAAPPTDDDDAFALTAALREDARNPQGGGFVVSCDMFRDAISREGESLRQWLQVGSENKGPGRISFAFCDMGSTDDYGDKQMDFLPNPRHPLVRWIESHHRSQHQGPQPFG